MKIELIKGGICELKPNTVILSYEDVSILSYIKSIKNFAVNLQVNITLLKI